MSNPWFRMYVDFLNDPKLIALAFEDQRHFIGILALKCDGALDSGAAPELLNRIVAQRLWIDHGVILEVKKRLIAAGLIDADWQPLAWNRRQFISDSDPTNAERQRRYRERKKTGSGDEALRNVTVTALDTDTDTDTETDKHKRTSAPATRLPADWMPSASDVEFCRTTRPDLNVAFIADGFRDYWIAQPGAKGRKADWSATWRNWIRNQRQQVAAPISKQANRDSYAAHAAAAAKRIGEPYEPDERDITGLCTRVA